MDMSMSQLESVIQEMTGTPFGDVEGTLPDPSDPLWEEKMIDEFPFLYGTLIRTDDNVSVVSERPVDNEISDLDSVTDMAGPEHPDGRLIIDLTNDDDDEELSEPENDDNELVDAGVSDRRKEYLLILEAEEEEARVRVKLERIVELQKKVTKHEYWRQHGGAELEVDRWLPSEEWFAKRAEKLERDVAFYNVILSRSFS